MKTYASILLSLLAACQSSPGVDSVQGAFRNTDTTLKDKSFGSFLRWKMNSTKPVPMGFERVRPDLSPWIQKDSTGLHALWVGHSTYLLRIGPYTVLTDPIFSDRASPVSWAGPQRTTAPALELRELPPIDVVILSHDHYDHTDLPSLKALDSMSRQKGHPIKFIAPMGFKSWFKDNGMELYTELNWWQSVDLGGIQLTSTPVQHWSKREFWGQNRRLWSGWMIKTAEFQVYFGGDTGYSKDFAETYSRLGAPDLALLPIGAYSPRWFMGDFHVDPAQAVQIHRDLHAKTSLAMHWGTFALADDVMDEPPKLLKEALQAQGLDSMAFMAPYHGALWTMGVQGLVRH